MDNTFNFNLIEGNFNSEEALKVLLSLINSKVAYHKLDRFSNDVRFGDQGDFHSKRIETLKMSEKALINFIEKAKSQNAVLRIKGNVEIVLENI